MAENSVELHIYKLGEQMIVEGKRQGKLNNGRYSLRLGEEEY